MPEPDELTFDLLIEREPHLLTVLDGAREWRRSHPRAGKGEIVGAWYGPRSGPGRLRRRDRRRPP
jgi:hypothetical protein